MTQVSFSEEDEILQKKIDKLAEKFNDKLINLIKEFSVKGQLETSDELANLDVNILDALKDSGLIQMYEYMLTITNKLNIENVKYYSSITKVETDIRSSNSVKYVLDNLKNNLLGQNIKTGLAQKIANTLRPLILSGADYATTKQALIKVIPPQLNKYLGQVTKGAFSVYDGAIQNSIAEKYNLTEGFYIGDLVESSRPFCVHMKDKYGSNPIKLTELQKDLDEYCPNGIPSDDKITIDGKQVKKGAGMMQLTTVKTFPMFKGGADNNCHHKWRWNI